MPPFLAPSDIARIAKSPQVSQKLRSLLQPPPKAPPPTSNFRTLFASHYPSLEADSDFNLLTKTVLTSLLTYPLTLNLLLHLSPPPPSIHLHGARAESTLPIQFWNLCPTSKITMSGYSCVTRSHGIIDCSSELRSISNSDLNVFFNPGFSSPQHLNSWSSVLADSESFYSTYLNEKERDEEILYLEGLGFEVGHVENEWASWKVEDEGSRCNMGILSVKRK